MAAADRAKSTLVHYFRLLADRSGVPLEWDCIAEIEGIVDDIIDATMREVADREEHRKP